MRLNAFMMVLSCLFIGDVIGSERLCPQNNRRLLVMQNQWFGNILMGADGNICQYVNGVQGACTQVTNGDDRGDMEIWKASDGVIYLTNSKCPKSHLAVFAGTGPNTISVSKVGVEQSQGPNVSDLLVTFLTEANEKKASFNIWECLMGSTPVFTNVPNKCTMQPLVKLRCPAPPPPAQAAKSNRQQLR